MFDRFTDRAKKVMTLARKAAIELNHDQIGAEHILIGLIDESTSVAVNVLKGRGVDLEQLRRDVVAAVVPGQRPVTAGQMPFTRQAKQVLEMALEEAGLLDHHYLGTEHLLLGLLREDAGIAGRVLRQQGFAVDALRQAVRDFLGETSAMAGARFGEASAMAGARSNEDGRDVLVLLPEGTRFDNLLTQTILSALQDAGVTVVCVEGLGLGPKCAPTLERLRQPALLLVVMNGLDADAIYALGYRHGLGMVAFGIVERSVQPASGLIPPQLLAFDDTADGREQLRKDVAEVARMWLGARGG
jgi:hypothetical protein